MIHVNRARPLVLAFLCLVLFVAFAAAAGTPDSASQQKSILVSNGGDSFGTLLQPSSSPSIGSGSQPPAWIGLFVLVVGSLLGALWLGIVLLAVLNQVEMSADSIDQERTRPSQEHAGEKRGGQERRRRPAPHPSDWL